MRLALIILVSLSAFLPSCYEHTCDRHQICTKELRMITLDVVDSNGDQVTLDSGKTYSDGQLLFSESYRSEAPVVKYPNVVITDSEIDQIAFDGTTILFKSWVEGNPVPDQQFVIGKDCCHIEKLEGPDSITLE